MKLSGPVLLFFLLLFLISSAARAQKKMIEKITKSVMRIDSINKVKEARGAPILSPIIFPGYTPEAGFILGLGGLLTFSTNKSDTALKRSSLPFIITYSTKGNLFISLPMHTYWFGDKLRISHDLWYKNQPDHYWGVGYEKGSTVPQGDSTTRYKAIMWQFAPYVVYKVIKDLYVGVPFNFNRMDASDLNPLMKEDQYILEDGTEILSTGMGIGVKYDTRDLPENAWKGIFVGILGTFYGGYLGGNAKYNIFVMDYRQYATIGRKGSTLAWRLNGRITSKSTPWPNMSRIGGSKRLRGYFESRYRDYDALFTIIEYRRTFKKKNGDLSKHGAVAWVGGGYVASDNLALDNVHLLPNYGFGYRLEIQTRMNLRLDFGFGQDAFGVYFGFQEAF